MNIFVLDITPSIAAQYHCDKHVVKMVLETAQMLSTIHTIHPSGDTSNIENMYKATHTHHPCIKWLEQSIENYQWLSELGLALCTEYTKRYKRRHLVEDLLWQLWANEPNLAHKQITNFAQCMPEKYKVKKGNLDDAVAAYRAYYVGEKSYFAQWYKGDIPPAWFLAGIANSLA